MAGDTVAVLLHLHPDGSRFEFFKNGRSQGVAFDKLPWEAVRDGYGACAAIGTGPHDASHSASVVSSTLPLHAGFTIHFHTHESLSASLWRAFCLFEALWYIICAPLAVMYGCLCEWAWWNFRAVRRVSAAVSVTSAGTRVALVGRPLTAVPHVMHAVRTRQQRMERIVAQYGACCARVFLLH
jgi:hypothetical protein